MKWYKKVFALSALLFLCALAAGCGKKKEAAFQKVLEISITPGVTPTMAPGEVNQSAVETNGGMTMVNEYLAGAEPKTDGLDVTPAADGADVTPTADGTDADDGGEG